MPLVALKCPDCGRATVYNSSGICKCGAQLISNLRPGRPKFIRRDRRVWVFTEDGPILWHTPES